ncbi:YdeI/OmpD-associated family protein [Niabella hibiscisoli]|uniref:YdeI/OmpD-associated family protein n=1 Tax=Niabella hibiscisoli TaxID=1825928 RepID=UPI00374DD2B7
MAKNKTAKAVFEKFAPSHRKEYIQWITEAKTDATRDKRITSAIEWIAEGKGRNWKYERK